MPLRDHFHPPLDERPWESLHTLWASSIVTLLNGEILPNQYYADAHVHVSQRVVVDVAGFSKTTQPVSSPSGTNGGTATATAPAPSWAPPAPLLEWEAVFPKRIEVLVFKNDGGSRLVAAVEIISPGNKDRHEYRNAFAIKCANYLHHGIGLVMMDIVTNRSGNLHNSLVELLELGDKYHMTGEDPYVVAYRPVRINSNDVVQAWPNGCAIGEKLPTVPLALDQGKCVPLDLETTYESACGQMRLPTG